MKRCLTLLVLLLSLARLAQAQPLPAKQRLLDYFKRHGGGAVIKKYADWKAHGTDSIGRPEGLFITTEDVMERIVQEAQLQGGGRAVSVPYLARMLGTESSWRYDDTLVRFHIPPEVLDSLHIRLPKTTDGGVNGDFIPGGRTKGGFNEAYIDRLPLSMTAHVPNFFGDSSRYELLFPDLRQRDNGAAADGDCARPLSGEHFGAAEVLLLVLPLLLFIGLLALFRSTYSLENLRSILSENTASKITVKNPEYTTANLNALVDKSRQAADALILEAAKANAAIAKTAAADAAAKLAGETDDTKKPDLQKLVSETSAALVAANERLIALAPAAANAATIANLVVALPPTIEISAPPAGNGSPDFRPSASRLIAFVSGLLLMVVALCMTSFFIYHYICTGRAPELNHLAGVLIALGVGMAPYAVNKITNASSAKS